MPDNESKSKEKSSVKKDKPQKKRTDGLKRFFRETKAEFGKIVWPTPKQTFNQTVIVLMAILIIGAFIWGLDTLDSWGLKSILNNF